MTKKITVSISDELHKRLQAIRSELTGSLKISSVCQNALLQAINTAEAFKVYKQAGRLDGKKDMLSLPEEIRTEIVKAIKGTDEKYKKLSLMERVSKLDFRFNRKDYDSFYPQLKDLMDGKVILHEWVNHDDTQVAEDRRSEATWSYIEGWYEGVEIAFTEKSKN